MSEQPTETPEEKPWLKKKQRVTPKVREALVELSEAARIKKTPPVRKIAQKHGVKYNTLNQAWYRFRHGLIDLGPKPAPKREVAMREEICRTLDTLAEIDQMLNDHLETAKHAMREAVAKGSRTGYEDSGVETIMLRMCKVDDLRKRKEKGYLSLLDKQNRREEKELKELGTIPMPPENPNTPAVIATSRFGRALDAQVMNEIFGNGPAVVEAEVVTEPA